MPPWILVLTTLAVGNYSNGAPSIETTTVRLTYELPCRVMERDFTYDRTVNGVRVTGRARCYLDAPDVVVPGRP